MKVLFVDDEYLGMLSETFESMETFYGKDNIFPFENAEKALVFLSSNWKNIDLAIIDEKLEGSLSGLELGANISKLYKTIAIVMFTGYPSIELCQKAIRLGFCDFIVKGGYIKSEDNLFKELERIQNLMSFINKQEAKANMLKLSQSWEEYKKSLASKYKNNATLFIKVKLLLVEKAFQLLPSMNDNQSLDYIVPFLKRRCEENITDIKGEPLNIDSLSKQKSEPKADAMATDLLPKIQKFLSDFTNETIDTFHKEEWNLCKMKAKEYHSHEIGNYFQMKNIAPKKEQIMQAFIELGDLALPNLLSDRYYNFVDIVSAYKKQKPAYNEK